MRGGGRECRRRQAAGAAPPPGGRGAAAAALPIDCACIDHASDAAASAAAPGRVVAVHSRAETGAAASGERWMNAVTDVSVFGQCERRDGAPPGGCQLGNNPEGGDVAGGMVWLPSAIQAIQ